VLEQHLSDKARSLRDQLVLGIHELLSPDVFLVEVARALTRAQRQGRIIPLELSRISPFRPSRANDEADEDLILSNRRNLG
jgi:hypothetical protein